MENTINHVTNEQVDSSIAKFLKNEENLQKIREQQRAAKREAEEKAREQQKEKERQKANPVVATIPLRSSISSYTPSPELVEIISKNSGTDAASTFSDDSTSDDQPKHNYLSERKRRRKEYGEPSSETEPSSNNGDEEEPFDDEEEDELVDMNQNQNHNKTKDSDTTSHFSDGMSMSSSREDEDESERVMKILYKLTKEKLFHHSEIYNEICQRLQKSWDFDEAISFRQLRKLLLNILVDNAESIGGYLLKCFPPEFDDSSSVELVQSTGHSLSLLLDSCRCLTHSTDATALSFVEDFSDDEPS